MSAEADADRLREALDERKQDALDELTKEVFDRFGPVIACQLASPEAPSVRVFAICRAVARWILRVMPEKGTKG